MAQSSHNPLSFLKSANTSSTSLDRSPGTRSRSGSFLRAISLHPSTTTGNQSPTVSLSRTNTTGSTMSSMSQLNSTSTNDEEPAFSCNPEDFEIKNPIGYGSSAVVYNATYLSRNMRIAVKVIDLDFFERNQIDELRRETALMALSKHPNVLRVYGSFVNGSKLYIATPYLSGGSCLDIMKNGFKDGLEESVIATILRQALEGLVYLHKNGHIHRDVKAGNLLMDDQGTVLLGDFGVSSSLTENNEVRKTFVGTPCWMAPEVMEQSGYDFKADIWSFGITAIELATGHAPFAKFPPMKVLMMTLNHRPPTLEREHTRHKFSRMFKEMIDLCLNKDPSKRPSAEKLLLHPFFKQAKRREYLVKAVLAFVPSLDRRTHKKMAFKQTTLEDTTQWDFDTPTEEHPPADPKPSDVVPTQKHISFGDVVVKNSPSSDPVEISSPIPVRKSRFVIEDNNLTEDRHESTFSSQRSLSPMNTYKADPDVKSYFNNDTPSHNDGHWQSSMEAGLGISTIAPAAPLSQQQQEHLGVRKGRFSVNQANLPTAIRTSNFDFTVGQMPTQALDSPLETRSPAMSRIASNDSMKGGEQRKSRFEVQHIPTPVSAHPQTYRPTSPPAPPSYLHGALDNQTKSDTLSREGSCRHQRNISRDSVSSCRISRFSIEKEDSNSSQQSTVESVHPFEAVCAPECRKKGRFELTGGMTNAEKLDSPQLTVHGSSSAHSTVSSTAPYSDLPSSVHGYIEALLKQTEIQKAMLHDLLSDINTRNVPTTRGRSASFENRKTFNSFEQLKNANNPSVESKPLSQNEIDLTMERLQHLLLTSSQEKERLLKENELLKKEVERLRKHQLPPSVSTLPPPSASILKSPPTPSVSMNKKPDEPIITVSTPASGNNTTHEPSL
ncbi:unnamed protein product [Mucor hiemalis]